jgi:hypothetical protein
MFKVTPASLQTFIDTPNCVLEDRVQYTVIMVSDLNCLKYFCAFWYCNHQVHRHFLITLHMKVRMVGRCGGIGSSLAWLLTYFHQHSERRYSVYYPARIAGFFITVVSG